MISSCIFFLNKFGINTNLSIKKTNSVNTTEFVFLINSIFVFNTVKNFFSKISLLKKMNNYRVEDIVVL